MYTIYADDNILYSPKLMQETIDPADIGKYALISPKLTLELNHSGSCSFTIPMSNRLYGSLEKLTSVISVYDDDVELFTGRILDSTEDYYKNEAIYCEGKLAILNDSMIRPYQFTGSPSDLFAMFIRDHNSRVDLNKQFIIGLCDVTTEGNITRYKENYDGANTFEEISEKLLDSVGGYLKLRHEPEGFYIDYLKEAGDVSEQIIQFGENLLDLKKIIDASAVFTVIIPIGAEDLTIEEVNDGKDYIESSVGIDLFGRIEKVVKWDDITSAEHLKELGTAMLNNAILTAITLECTAVDMKMLGVDVNSFRLGDRIRLVSVPHDIDEYFTCSKIDYDLEKPQNTKYTLGATRSSLTGRSASNAIMRIY